jgi:hypothetical protein
MTTKKVKDLTAFEVVLLAMEKSVPGIFGSDRLHSGKGKRLHGAAPY